MRYVPIALLAAILCLGSRSGTSCAAHWQLFAYRHIPPLADVFAVSADDVWAVGGAEGGDSGPVVAKPVIVHWDGRAIGVQRFPWKDAAFNGVSGTGAGDIWAVGSVGDQPLVVHWDGVSWKRARVPRLREGWLGDVTAVSASDVWAVGGGGLGYRPLVMHWNGRRWRALDLRAVVPSDTMLISIDSDDRGDVWAAGADYQHAPVSFGYVDLVMRLVHGRWQRIHSPLESIGGPMADALDIGLSGDVWTTNSDFSGNGPWFVRWAHANPSRASVSDALNLEPSIGAVAAIDPGDVWAVGSLEYREIRGHTVDANSPLILHWDGRRWRVQPTPFDHLKNLVLAGVDALDGSDIWAVGHHVIVRYSC